MLPLTFVITRASAFLAADLLPWLAKFTTRLIARRLDVPEVVVHGICLYVAAYLSEVERNATPVCPIRVFLDLRRHRLPAAGRSSLPGRGAKPETRAA